MDAPNGPPTDTVDLYVEIDEGNLHFLDTIVSGYDGIANVRRDYRLHHGRTYFRILVSPDFIAEINQVLEQVQDYIEIGEIYMEP
ncbi:MAG: hypothetical protein ACE5JP_13495 [Candidatus Bipolaricaulia bacterium]